MVLCWKVVAVWQAGWLDLCFWTIRWMDGRGGSEIKMLRMQGVEDRGVEECFLIFILDCNKSEKET